MIPSPVAPSILVSCNSPAYTLSRLVCAMQPHKKRHQNKGHATQGVSSKIGQDTMSASSQQKKHAVRHS